MNKHILLVILLELIGLAAFIGFLVLGSSSVPGIILFVVALVFFLGGSYTISNYLLKKTK